MTAEALSQVIADAMDDKKAIDIVVMDLRNIKNTVSDFFVICSANSDTQVEAIADSIEEKVSKAGEASPYRVEGKNNNQWVLIDYVDVVAHIFLKDKREFYGLEDLWGDAILSKVHD
ncbi:ribosome silencing factor [Algoriphagus formosus]|jgi:ribosome-associated protein|uniref:Ribosomal silencing factor RsfS n=2 Tax=Algoriphagus TaxID=246875 RepID=A0A0P8ACJ5_9BACT|nr:ribosome silencing factor [Algoriphagus aquimaris]KPQ13038.1 MAG: ribosome silencing factor [Algoriphagus marincola HL-49]TDK44892.1 ribosome silencing factor [Algoriphagus aquimaris]